MSHKTLSQWKKLPFVRTSNIYPKLLIESVRLKAFDWKCSIESVWSKAFDWKRLIESVRLKAFNWKRLIKSVGLKALDWKRSIESVRLKTFDWKRLIESVWSKAFCWKRLIITSNFFHCASLQISRLPQRQLQSSKLRERVERLSFKARESQSTTEEKNQLMLWSCLLKLLQFSLSLNQSQQKLKIQRWLQAQTLNLLMKIHRRKKMKFFMKKTLKMTKNLSWSGLRGMLWSKKSFTTNMDCKMANSVLNCFIKSLGIRVKDLLEDFSGNSKLWQLGDFYPQSCPFWAGCLR